MGLKIRPGLVSTPVPATHCQLPAFEATSPLVSTDASVFVNPGIYQYDRHNDYLYGTFAPKLRARIGDATANMILRDNVIYAFRKGSRVP